MAPTEDMELQPCAPNTEPHDIWIKFLQERIEVNHQTFYRVIFLTGTPLKVLSVSLQKVLSVGIIYWLTLRTFRGGIS